MDLTAHPCFDDSARKLFGRMHLPVAPRCNVQCNYCDRRFDCANENRPGVTTGLMTSSQAVAYVDDILGRDPSMRVVGIAGPGDPLATAESTLSILRQVRERHPETLLCIATNGLALAEHAGDLAAIGVSHVTVTVNTVDPHIGGEIYRWIRTGSMVYRGIEAGKRMWEAQSEGIRALVRLGVTVKVNVVLIPGINLDHVDNVAREVASLGASRLNCIALHPVAGTPFGDFEQPSPATVHAVRKACATYLPQMEHCTRCRADAVGRLGESPSEEQLVLLRRHVNCGTERPYVAVASQEGMLVNQHLGEASRWLVYERRDGTFVLVEERDARCTGGGAARWRNLAGLLSDCRALLTSGAGPSPKKWLAQFGLPVLETEGLVDDALDAVYAGRPLPKARSHEWRCGKGSECLGDGTACG
jgi:nitrogen fixation protein NifB